MALTRLEPPLVSYANQGSRNSAILPFTSALSAFCAAATAAMVELPFIDAVSAAYGTIGEGKSIVLTLRQGMATFLS
jgi:hypothetical protein